MGTAQAGESGRGMRSKRRFSTTRSRALGPTSSAKRRNHGCSPAGQASTFSRTPVHLPLAGPRSTGSAAPDHRQRMPNVWQTARSAASSLARIGVEQAEGRLLPRGVLADALGERRDAVVRARVDVARPARPHVERVPGPRPLRQDPRAAHVEGEDPHLEPRLLERLDRLAARVHDRVDERVVAEVGPAVVHVQDAPRRSCASRRPARPRGAPRGRTRRSRRGRSPGSP